MTSKGIPPMHGKALNAFRNSDFSPESAIAEVIDNSIQAKSKNIKIHFEFTKPAGKNKERPSVIVFGDDGVGMDTEILQKCLVLGESTRENDRDGIGRFGVGMTNGAISVCNKIQVYSRPFQGNWNFVELNLKNLDESGSPFITYIKEKKLPAEYKHLVGDYGTLVVWDDIDRIDTTFKIPVLKHWLSRTFRKFIGEKIIEENEVIDNPNPINLEINVIGTRDWDGNEILDAFDPLYVILNKKRPNDDTAHLEADYGIEFEVGSIDIPKDDSKIGKIRIRMSLTPPKWRTGGVYRPGGSPENIARHLDDNEGISILRNHREVFYGEIPNWTPKFQDVDRWWSCEIDFDAVLDHQFSVRNIKVGARPLPELRAELESQINQERNRLVAIYQTEKKNDDSDSLTGGDVTSGHEDAHVGEKEVIIPEPIVDLTPEEKAEQKEALKQKEISEAQQKEVFRIIEDPKSPPIVLMNNLKSKPNENFLEIEKVGGKTLVWLNMNHEFFHQVYVKLKEMTEIAEKSKDPQQTKLLEIAKKLKRDIDMLIIAFADTRNISIKTNVEFNDRIEFFLINWSLCLRRLYNNTVD